MKEAILAAGAPGYVFETSVRFQDVDAAGIVFFARVLEYFHDAEMAFFADAGWPVPQALESGTISAPLSHAEVDYLAPLRFGDRVRVELVGKRVDRSDVTLAHRLTKESGEVAAVGHLVHAFIDRKTFKRTALPEAVARAVAALPDV